MGMKKYAVGEQMDLFTDAENQVVKTNLARTGKTRAAELSEAERAQMQKELSDLNTDQ
jgi:hypothetical protein